MTPFRKSQARAVLEGIVRGLAPHMAGPDALRQAVAELARDPSLWVELELARLKLPEPTRVATMETSSVMGPIDG